MSDIIRITTPLSDSDVEALRIGDLVRFYGVIYTGRDMAHRRLIELLDQDKELPFNPEGQVIYYVGPSPNKPGEVIGSCGPTTAYRMDPYAPRLLERGIKGMIGKGKRSTLVKEALNRTKAVYFAATGGAGALISRSIKKMELVAYEDLGPEAIYRLEVEDFPAIVANDMYGGDLYEKGIKAYAR